MKPMTDSMFELTRILKLHAMLYPKMQPADAVKLIYQNEFGGGHLICDEEACLNYLHREYESVEKNPTMPLYEDIGNGIVRVNLAAVKEEDLDQLGKDFIRSATEHKGTMSRFLSKLSILVDLVSEGAFVFEPTELAAYLADYKNQGCPVVSHSEVYRNAYHPAYRVIKKLR